MNPVPISANLVDESKLLEVQVKESGLRCDIGSAVVAEQPRREK